MKQARQTPPPSQGVSPVDDIINRFGDKTFLVPCKRGTKEPMVKYANRRFESTKRPAYLAKFAEGPANIAIYLGKPSDGLCGFDFDRDEDLAKFLDVNPKLKCTTRTKAKRGATPWVRIIGEFPESCSTPHFEWRADRRLSTVWGRHPDGMDYQFLVDAPPIEIAFDEINWPEGWELPWKAKVTNELKDKYGEPFYFNAKGYLTQINESYWAGLYAAENTILFEPEESSFYRYNSDTGLYEVESADSIRTKLSSRMLEVSRQANVFDLQKKRGASVLNNVIAQLRGIVEHRNAFSEQKRIIHVANGVIVFDGNTADLLPFSPEFRSRNRSPIIFDPKARCDRFLNELVISAVHPEDVELLQKASGMFLLGYNRAQRIFILDGEAGRGKTQFANAIQGLVGRANVTQLRTKQLSERFELFRFLKKTLLVGVDVEPDFLSTQGAAVLKGLVGGDMFDAEQKGGTGCFPMQGLFNVIITSNARLRVRLQGDVGAWKRRIIIVRYEAPAPKKKISDFGQYLIGIEGSGILNWALLGAQKVLNEIPQSGGDFLMTKRQRGVVDSLLAESDSLRYFLNERVQKDECSDVTVTELVEAYAAYCPEKHWQALPITEVHGKLEGLMLELFGVPKSNDIKRNEKSQRGFHRVKLLPTQATQFGAAGKDGV